MLKFSPEIVFFPPAICPIYTQYTYTQIDALRVELTVLVPDVTICVYIHVLYIIYIVNIDFFSIFITNASKLNTVFECTCIRIDITRDMTAHALYPEGRTRFSNQTNF